MYYLVFLLLVPWMTVAEYWPLDDYYNFHCEGVYSKSSIPAASMEALINVTVASEGPVTLAIYNYKDDHILHPSEKFGRIYQLCGNSGTIEDGLCTQNDTGKFIVKKEQPQFQMLNVIIAPNGPSVQYSVANSGYYCVLLASSARPALPFTAISFTQSPYGLLPGDEYPKLPFYAILSIVYFVIGLLWSFKTYLYWENILPIQNYIAGVIFAIFVEQIINYVFYENFNRTGMSSKFLMSLVAIASAGRNSSSFFILLIVSLGYGVVCPTLGETMKRCILLAVLHFVFGVSYVFGAMTTEDLDMTSVIIFVLPLSITMTIFYYWILNSLDVTMKKLEIRKQTQKLEMFKKLTNALIISVYFLLFYFLLNSIVFSYRNGALWIPYYWQLKWFLMDGWLNLQYLAFFIAILLLWQPTENNQRYGLDELAQEDHDMDYIGVMGNDEELQNQVKIATLKEEQLEAEGPIFTWHEDEEEKGPERETLFATSDRISQERPSADIVDMSRSRY